MPFAYKTATLSMLAQLQKVQTAEALEAIADQLMQSKDENAVPYLQELLASGDTHIQCLACLILSEIQDKSAIASLLECLNKTDSFALKLSILNALFCLPDPIIIPHLLPYLSDPEISIVCAAVSVLSAILISYPHSTIPPNIYSALMALLVHENLQIRLSSAGILCRLGEQSALPVIADLITHDSLAVRLSAISSLALCPLLEARPLVQNCLSDADNDVRLTAQNVLNSMI